MCLFLHLFGFHEIVIFSTKTKYICDGDLVGVLEALRPRDHADAEVAPPVRRVEAQDRRGGGDAHP